MSRIRLSISSIFVTFLSLVWINSTQASNDQADRQELRTFFRGMLAGHEKPYTDLHYGQFIDHIWTSFYKGEEFAEVLAEDNLTKNGYVTLRFSIPQGYVDSLKVSLEGSLEDFKLPLFQEANTPKYQTGFLGCALSVDKDDALLMTRLHIYEDKRQNRFTNVWRYNMPTKIAHLNSENFKTYRCHIMHGFIVEWMLLMGKDREIAKDPFSSLILQQLDARFRNTFATQYARWSQINDLIGDCDERFKLTTGNAYPANNEGSSFEKLMCSVRAYNKAMHLKPLPAVFKKEEARLRSVQLLKKPITSSHDLEYLFKPGDGLHFIWGGESLRYFYERFRYLDSGAVISEAGVLIENRFSMLPMLLNRDMGNMKKVNLEAFIFGQLQQSQNALVDAHALLHEIAPSTQRLSVVAEKMRTYEGTRPRAASKFSIQKKGQATDIVRSMMALPHLARVVSEIDLESYPFIEERDAYINLVNVSSGQLAGDCLSELKHAFPEFAQTIGTYFHVHKSCDAVKIMPIVEFNLARREKLEEIWLKYLLSEITVKIQKEKGNQTQILVELLDRINKALKQRMCDALKSLGVKKLPEAKKVRFAKKTSELEDQITPFLEELEKMPVEIYALLSDIPGNTKLLTMISDLSGLQNLDLYSIGALKFLKGNYLHLNLGLLNMFGTLYQQHYAVKPFENPLGKKADIRLASFLAAMLKGMSGLGIVAEENAILKYTNGIKDNLAYAFVQLREFNIAGHKVN